MVSDWAAVPQLIPQGAAADRKEAARLAVNAGLDMDMVGHCYDNYLDSLVREGAVSEERIDDAVRRVLTLKFRLGLFERPYTEEVPADQRLLLPQNRELAERLAEESIVLLKNEGGLLPLQGQRTIAVLGPIVDAPGELLGSWSGHGRGEEVYPVRDALTEEFGGTSQVIFHAGCPFDGDDRSGFASALEAAREADVVVLFMGERRGWSGENGSRSSIELPEIQEEFIVEMQKAGKPMVLVLSSGRPLALQRVEPLCDAMQIPVYYNRRQSSRPRQGLYQDIPSTPLYEFGHGLSYTSFEYGDLKLSRESVTGGETLTAEISVTNTGERDGAETVHWFISDPACRITRPLRELKHFEKQVIPAGETRVFRFRIDPARDLSFVDSDGNRFLEPGDYYIMVKDRKVRLQSVCNGRPAHPEGRWRSASRPGSRGCRSCPPLNCLNCSSRQSQCPDRPENTGILLSS